MNDARRRQVAMIKREITFTLERLEIIRKCELESLNPIDVDIMAPTMHLAHASESLEYALDHLTKITEWN